MKTVILILILGFGLNSIAKGYAMKDSIKFSGSGYLIIKKKTCSFYQINVWGQIILSSKRLFFKPFRNKQYLKELSIPLDSIEMIAYYNPINKYIIWHRHILIKTKDREELNLDVVLRTEQLFKLITNAVKDTSTKDNDTLINKPLLCNSNNNEAYIRLHYIGSTIYSPLNAKGCFQMEGTSFTFTPMEYTQYLRTINIPISYIRSIKKQGRRRVQFELDSGTKYVFVVKNRIEFIKNLHKYI